MLSALPIDSNASSSDLVRTLRTQHNWSSDDEVALPESVLWQCFLALQRRGDERASTLFIKSLKTLHGRRSLNNVELPTQDLHPDEHRMADDVMLAELWKAYKRCICAQRTGPAAQLLRDMEAHLTAH